MAEYVPTGDRGGRPGETLGDAIGLLRDLVAFDTTSRNSNIDLIDYVTGYLDRYRIPWRLFPSDDGTKANVFATIGPPVEGGIVLSGHSDVVPIDGQDWTTDPFRLTERAGRLYARGSADMKGFIACALAMAPRFAAADMSAPLHLALSYDEEVGCLGVGRMIEAIGAELPRPAAVIVGEPTGMRIASAHKGICALTTTIRGREAHSSRPADGVNAIAFAAEFVGHLYRLCDRLAESRQDPRFDPPHTTFNTGLIRGGDAINIIARECIVNWEFRPIPGADPDTITAEVARFVEDDLLPRMRAVDPATSVDTRRELLVPPFDAPEGSAAETIARQATGLNSVGTLAFVTEASLFSKAGLPAIICGPGDIAQAHQPDEFVEIAQLDACLDFMENLVAPLTKRR